MRERPKLAGLSGEGRSSATTLLVSTALEWMNGNNSGVPKEKRKLLGFTDNRQDAALQAGYFNDFLFVSLLRGTLLRAVLDAGDDGMAEDEFGLRVVKALGFTTANKNARIHWMLDPEAGAVVREDAQRSLAKVLAHRLWTDLRRGWRYTNPSLSVLKLIDVAFIGLDEDRENLTKSAAYLKAAGESEQFLPALFCSPTMELGVDISALNAVHLRNVPPTPANYAQRAGRAGRSGQAAVIVTYCAAQSPHDQYFFERRNEMVAGVVRPPALDITNEELVRSHRPVAFR